MGILNLTEPHYLRCMKPNSLNRPQKFENQSILHQLRCVGVLEAVRINLGGYPTQRTYAEFVDHFGLLVPEYMDRSHTDKLITEKILLKLKLERFKLGKSKVFLRAGQIKTLESRRAEVLDTAALALQVFCRGCLVRTIFTAKRKTAASIILQKYFRRWLSWRRYNQLHAATVLIQSCIQGSSSCQKYLYQKKQRAVTVIQAQWRMWKIRSVFRHRLASIIAIHSLGMQKLAKQELQRLRREANEAGVLRLAKNKLEKQLEDITCRLHLEKRLRVSHEEAKIVEITKLQKNLVSLTHELDAATLATVNECHQNVLLQHELELSLKQKTVLERHISSMVDLRNENELLKISIDTLQKNNSSLELTLAKAQDDSNANFEKQEQVEEKDSQLHMNMQSLVGRLKNMEDESYVLQTSTLSSSPKSIRHDYVFESHELLSKCIKGNLGFKDGKPVAACIIYKCLLQWHAFEFEGTAIFDFIIDGINGVLKAGNENVTLPYWLSNSSAILCLLQENSRSNGFVTASSQRFGEDLNVTGRLFQGSPLKQLTACVENIFCSIRNNLRKEIAPLLTSCIQAPISGRVHAGKSSRSSRGALQLSPSSQWDSMVTLLDYFMSCLRENYVPSFFIRKLIAQVFHFINISLFNSLLLRRGCCTFSNGEFVKSGLAELEKWIANATEEFAGTSWHELSYIRQAVRFLVTHQKRKKSLSGRIYVRQIYRISTMYWDDKYKTQSVSNEVVAQMREILNSDSQNHISNLFLLGDDLSIPFSTDDIYMAIPSVDPSDVEFPSSLSACPSSQFLSRSP